MFLLLIKWFFFDDSPGESRVSMYTLEEQQEGDMPHFPPGEGGGAGFPSLNKACLSSRGGGGSLFLPFLLAFIPQKFRGRP